ncbi:hypothetical protein AX16_010530 [Volvariella volvacea WC 439]|nr:hypothetical protein AX16_010530 [Volvariella volvacea WC 439]
MCKHIFDQETVYCVNPYGVTTTAFPSESATPTSALVIPSATMIPETDPSILYAPADAWNISESRSECTLSTSLHVSNTLNATISFNYTGPGIIVHTVASPNGGIFSVLIDDFNTTAFVDTNSAAGRPECYVLQFPPVSILPPGYESRDDHSITLVYIGPSVLAASTNVSETFIQFDSFALPIYSPAEMTYGGQSGGIWLNCL